MNVYLSNFENYLRLFSNRQLIIVNVGVIIFCFIVFTVSLKPRLSHPTSRSYIPINIIPETLITPTLAPIIPIVPSYQAVIFTAVPLPTPTETPQPTPSALPIFLNIPKLNLVAKLIKK